jgi:type IV pilus assembly protein PilN
MIRINLLPVRQIKQRIKARQELGALLVGLFVLLGMIALSGYRQATKVTELQDAIARLTQEKQQYQAVVAQIEKIKKDQAVIEIKLSAIKGLKFASQLPARVLDEIANITPPDRMWLTSLDYAGNVLTIAGTALDNATIAEYMNKIGQSDLFLGSELKNSSLSLVGNLKLKSFSMTINVLAPPASPEPVPAAKK